MADIGAVIDSMEDSLPDDERDDDAPPDEPTAKEGTGETPVVVEEQHNMRTRIQPSPAPPFARYRRPNHEATTATTADIKPPPPAADRAERGGGSRRVLQVRHHVGPEVVCVILSTFFPFPHLVFSWFWFVYFVLFFWFWFTRPSLVGATKALSFGLPDQSRSIIIISFMINHALFTLSAPFLLFVSSSILGILQVFKTCVQEIIRITYVSVVRIMTTRSTSGESVVERTPCGLSCIASTIVFLNRFTCLYSRTGLPFTHSYSNVLVLIRVCVYTMLYLMASRIKTTYFVDSIAVSFRFPSRKPETSRRRCVE